MHALRRRHRVVKCRRSLEGRQRAVAVQLARAPEEVRRIQVAERKIGVRHRGFSAALAIGDRPRHRPGAARPDLQRAGSADMADRPTAGTERDDIEALQRDALTGHGASTPQRRLAILHPRDVGRGAADIEGDEVVAQAPFSQRDTGRDPARRPRQRGAGGGRAASTGATPPCDRMTNTGPA